MTCNVVPILYRPNEKSVTLYLRIERRHTNPAGSAHGGLLMTMMDLTLTRLLTFASGRLRAGERTLLTATGVFRNPPEKGAVSV